MKFFLLVFCLFSFFSLRGQYNSSNPKTSWEENAFITEIQLLFNGKYDYDSKEISWKPTYGERPQWEVFINEKGYVQTSFKGEHRLNNQLIWIFKTEWHEEPEIDPETGWEPHITAYESQITIAYYILSEDKKRWNLHTFDKTAKSYGEDFELVEFYDKTFIKENSENEISHQTGYGSTEQIFYNIHNGKIVETFRYFSSEEQDDYGYQTLLTLIGNNKIKLKTVGTTLSDGKNAAKSEFYEINHEGKFIKIQE